MLKLSTASILSYGCPLAGTENLENEAENLLLSVPQAIAIVTDAGRLYKGELKE